MSVNDIIFILKIKNGDSMRDEILKNYIYVCPYCFNKIKECTCLSYPSSLIQIDKNILPSIKILNEKWYFTETCCEGHIGGNEKIHIIFKKSYKFKVLPHGFSYNDNLLIANITGTNEHAKKIKKTKLLKNLNQWTNTIESRNPADK